MIRWDQRWEALIPRKPNASLYCYAVVLITQTTFSSTGNWVTTTLAIQIPPHNSLSSSPHQQETNLWQTKCIIPFQSDIARLDSYLWEVSRYSKNKLRTAPFPKPFFRLSTIWMKQVEPTIDIPSINEETVLMTHIN